MLVLQVSLFAECHYAECCFSECNGALSNSLIGQCLNFFGYEQTGKVKQNDIKFRSGTLFKALTSWSFWINVNE